MVYQCSWLKNTHSYDNMFTRLICLVLFVKKEYIFAIYFLCSKSRWYSVASYQMSINRTKMYLSNWCACALALIVKFTYNCDFLLRF